MFSSHLRIEKQQKRRLNLEQPAPNPLQCKIAIASSSHQIGVSCRKLGLMWCFNCQRHWGPAGTMAQHSTRERRSMQPLQHWKRGNEWSELILGWSKDLKPAKCPSAASSWAFNYGQPETSSVCWQLGSNKRWSAQGKSPLGGQRQWSGAVTKRTPRPHGWSETCRQQWTFDCIVNSKTFSPGNTVCKYQLFFELLHIVIEMHPLKVVQLFSAQLQPLPWSQKSTSICNARNRLMTFTRRWHKHLKKKDKS